MKRLQTAIDKAASVAVNESAKKIRHATIQEFDKKFDKSTPFTKRSMRVKEWATPAKLSATVELRDDNPAWRRSLAHQFTGGSRQWKKSEAALMRVGILPAGMAAIPAKSSWAIRLDPYGNMSPGQIVQILAYFQAFGEQGYKANMDARGRAKLAKMRGGAAGSGRGARSIGGVVYFVSRGKGNWFGGGSWAGGRMQHLPPGIWAKRGTHGADIAPVLMFVRRPTYRQRIDLLAIGTEVVGEEIQKDFSAALAYEIGKLK